MHVQGRFGATLGIGDQPHCRDQATRVVEMAVRQHHGVDRGKVDRKALPVALEGVGLGPGVEE